MSGADLFAEYTSALWRTRAEDLQPLRDAGVSDRTYRLLPSAAARITVTGAVYEPATDGGTAFVVPVRCDSPMTPETTDPDAAISDGEIVDLLAFHPRHEARWALRRGAAEWLGAIEPQNLGPDAVRIFRTPLGWLLSGCSGLVPLSRDRRDLYRLLSIVSTIVAEDAEHAIELRRVLQYRSAVPPVIVASKRGLLRAG